MRLKFKKPVMDKELKNNTDLANVLAVASVGAAALEMLEEILPSAAKDVEKATNELVDSFNVILNNIDTKDKKIAEAVQNIRVSLQFQDRNTQMIENAVNLLTRYRTLLEGVQDAATDHDIKIDISEPAEKILSGIKMSTIRTRFMEVLAKSSIPYSGGAIQCIGEQKDSGEVELF